MAGKKSVFDNPVLSTKVKSANVKIFPEALIGYLVGPFCGLLANSLLSTYLNTYFKEVLFFGVEKFIAEDKEKILARQKAEAEAAGIEWIEPEERLRREEEEADRLAEAARVAELKALCEKKGLSFEEEEAKYQAKQEEKRKAAQERAARRAAKGSPRKED